MDSVIRLAGKGIRHWLFKGKALIITGARQVGKTTLLTQFFSREENVLWLNADEVAVRERLAVQSLSALKQLIGHHKMVVIDEVQRVKNAGLLLKLMVDNFKQVQFIATGSSALDISETIFEPLTGRHILFHLYPFTLAEMYVGKTGFEIEQKLPFHLVYGSYPDIFNYSADAEVLLQNLANQYLYKDVLVWKDIRKPELLDKLLKLLAHQIGSEVSMHELANKLNVKSETIESYINLLEKSFVIKRLHAYSTNARKEVTKMTKIIFWDNGIRNAVIGDYDDLSNRTDQGKLWENFMISERLKMNAWTAPNIKSFFWRNLNQSEVDYVETFKDNVSAFEMKWNTKPDQKFSRAFMNSYPEAKNQIVTPNNFAAFCKI